PFVELAAQLLPALLELMDATPRVTGHRRVHGRALASTKLVEPVRDFGHLLAHQAFDALGGQGPRRAGSDLHFVAGDTPVITMNGAPLARGRRRHGVAAR